ncbi:MULTISPECIES: hypothetical protein [Aeromonas]|uniref:hypothetical protein n=1 Tax=Aeromonas TaxID=642 RepID=UPI001116468E|nr:MULTISPECIES: hypothetical protein [Aeromonas]MBL0520120.1 hypothetical protein [Aeromonas enteropelogenes]UNU88548.1 hypothetical protein GB930_10190 [Aeromonas dhakensis]
MFGFDIWNVASSLYFFIALITFLPILQALFKKVALHPGGKSFEESNYFPDSEKEKLISHYSRMAGTLGFWKNQALKFKRFHYYVLCWTIPSSVLIPVITQVTSELNGSKFFLTLISSFTAILLAFHRGLKVEDNYKSYRHGESEFFDTYRRLLDRPETFGCTIDKQLNTYFTEVESIRRYVRNAETDNLATMDEAKKKYESLQSGKA